MTDFRALCEELVGTWDAKSELGFSDWRNKTADIVERARAALAEQPVAEGPLKERPDFIAGYREGLADKRRIIEHEEAERSANALAEQPVGPTDEELEDFALQNGGGYFNCDCQEEADILTRKHVSNYRAVLAKWGQP
jgi:hypothetical protein